jgi:hypothetical protein
VEGEASDGKIVESFAILGQFELAANADAATGG